MGKDTCSHARTGVIMECLSRFIVSTVINSRFVLIIVVCIGELVVLNILK